MSDKTSDPKKKKEELINEAAERLAEIFIKQIEWEKDKKKKNHGKGKV